MFLNFRKYKFDLKQEIHECGVKDGYFNKMKYL